MADTEDKNTVPVADKRLVRTFLRKTNDNQAPVSLQIDNGGLAIPHDDIIINAGQEPSLLSTALKEIDRRLAPILGEDSYTCDVGIYSLHIGAPNLKARVSVDDVYKGEIPVLKQEEIYRAEVVLNKPLSDETKEQLKEVIYVTSPSDQRAPSGLR